MQSRASFIYEPAARDAAVNHCANYSIERQGTAAENRVNSNFLIHEKNLDAQLVAHLNADHNQFRHLVRIAHMIKLHLVFVYTYSHTYLSGASHV